MFARGSWRGVSYGYDSQDITYTRRRPRDDPSAALCSERVRVYIRVHDSRSHDLPGDPSEYEKTPTNSLILFFFHSSSLLRGYIPPHRRRRRRPNDCSASLPPRDGAIHQSMMGMELLLLLFSYTSLLLRVVIYEFLLWPPPTPPPPWPIFHVRVNRVRCHFSCCIEHRGKRVCHSINFSRRRWGIFVLQYSPQTLCARYTCTRTVYTRSFTGRRKKDEVIAGGCDVYE